MEENVENLRMQVELLQKKIRKIEADKDKDYLEKRLSEYKKNFHNKWFKFSSICFDNKQYTTIAYVESPVDIEIFPWYSVKYHGFRINYHDDKFSSFEVIEGGTTRVEQLTQEVNEHDIDYLKEFLNEKIEKIFNEIF